MHKKGVNPLIATVLLLAFAVALATVLVSLEPLGCKMKGVTIAEFNNGQQRICYDTDTSTIQAFILNQEEDTVTGLKIRVSGMKNTKNIEHLPVELGQNTEAKVSFDYDVEEYGKIVDLAILAQVNQSGRVKECKIGSQVQEITSCT